MADYLAPWRKQLQRALHRNRSQIFSRYFQLATISERGYPTNRTVVFRGFLNESNSIKIVTDTRSQKFAHLQNNPQAEICWYFSKTREQFRIRGKIDLVTQADENLNKLREEAWQKLSKNAKEQFLWPHPGKPVTDNLPPVASSFSEEKPVANFCLLLLNPQRVDHLELKSNPHNRCLYSLNSENQWLIDQVNP
jgi:PPOX class probable FMN-dependent enzyme